MKKKSKTVTFPSEIFVQNAVDDGSAGTNDDNWLVVSEDQAGVTHGVRCAIYQLKEVVVINKTESFTRTKSK